MIDNSSLFLGARPRAEGAASRSVAVDYMEQPFDFCGEFIDLICDKMYKVLRCHADAEISEVCFRVYECSLAEGMFGKESAIVCGLEIRNKIFDEVLADPANFNLMSLVRRIGLRHGALICALS